MRLLKDLKRIRAKHLYLADNPLTKKPQYPECLKPLQANFQFVVSDTLIELYSGIICGISLQDGMPFENLYKTYTPLNYEIDMECDGTRIDWSNKWRLDQFKDSQNWHAFLVRMWQVDQYILVNNFLCISRYPMRSM